MAFFALLAIIPAFKRHFCPLYD